MRGDKVGPVSYSAGGRRRGRLLQFCRAIPGGVEKIAAHFDEPAHVRTNREYVTYTGTLLGERVSVVSTGIGGPSAAIAMEELGPFGRAYLPAGGNVRRDPAGCAERRPGDRHRRRPMEGTSREYAPLEFPAVADLEK